MQLSRQKHSSVGPARVKWGSTLNRPADSSDAFLTKPIEGLQQVPFPTDAQAGPDLLLEPSQPMTLTRAGTARRPSQETEAMSKGLTDIGNGGLKPAPVADRADPEDSAAMPATIPGQLDRLGKPVEPGRDETVAPQAPSALGAHFHPGPIIATPQLKETLDGNVQGQYQGSALSEFYSLCSGVKGGCGTLYPILSTIRRESYNGRHILTKPPFMSRHREQYHHPFVSRFCKTTDMIDANPVLNPDTLGTLLEMAANFAEKGMGNFALWWDLTAEKAHYIRALKCCYGVS